MTGVPEVDILDWLHGEVLNLTLVGGAGVEPPAKENILKLPFIIDQDRNDDWLRTAIPGIVVSFGPDAKEVGRLNGLDDWAYNFVIQFLDREMSTQPEPEIVLAWKTWQRQVRRLFNQSDARGEIPGLNWLGVPSQEWVEKVRFQTHRLARWMIPVTASVRETRLAKTHSGGINGE